MLKTIKKISDTQKLYKTIGASNELILEAERQLNLNFSKEYKEYLSTYGAISFGSTEFTGLNIESYANVVSVTLKEKQRYDNFPEGCIVLENVGIDGILMLHHENGKVFAWTSKDVGDSYKSLAEYINSKIN